MSLYSATELVTIAIVDRAQLRDIAAELERRSPDGPAARHLVAAFRDGKAPPRLTAHLLGCIADEAGYDTVRSILLSTPGIVETYAGPALARIRGVAAFEDLRTLLLEAPELLSREGAAGGLAHLASRDAATAIFEAAVAARIRSRTAAIFLGGLPIDAHRVSALLSSEDLHSLGLGTDILWAAVTRSYGPNEQLWREINQADLALQLRKALAEPALEMSPSKREILMDLASRAEQNVQRRLLTPEQTWRAYDATEQRLTAPLSERMLDLAAIRPGMRILDLATGRGEPAIRAAHRVGPTGTVLGVDLSESLLKMARERAAREGLSNLDLRGLNAERLEGVPTAHFHATLVRWGLMYFDSPVDALMAARRAMVPRGVLVAAVWAEPERVPYFTLPRRVLGKNLPLPPIDPEAPGTFRYADTDRLHRDFAAAGFTIEHIEEQEVAVMEAATGAELIAWTRAFGLTRLLNDLPEEIQQEWEAELVKETEPLRKDGFVRLGGVTRIVVASSAE